LKLGTKGGRKISGHCAIEQPAASANFSKLVVYASRTPGIWLVYEHAHGAETGTAVRGVPNIHGPPTQGPAFQPAWSTMKELVG
jgi:hypothetical protein